MTAPIHDFDWFASRIEVARWNSETRGSRDVHAACPVCGGSDPLHVTEKNGKALVQCFSCDAKYQAVVDALEDAPEKSEEVVAQPVVRKRRTAALVSASEQPEQAVARVDDPLDWYASYCGVSLEWLKANIPVRATPDGWVAHTYSPSRVTKDRQPNSSARRWTPAHSVTPRLWPSPEAEMPEEIWLTEGESDCIVLRAAGLPAYTAGSASQPLDADLMRGLVRRGVQRVVVAYDSDKAGVKAREETLEAARDAGVGASVASLGDPLLGAYKDWRDRWLEGEREAPETDAQAGMENVYRLDEVESVEEEPLLLGRLHATDHTILFGDGGTGKGVIAAWWAAQLTRELKYRVLVVDYEAHAMHEWRPRVARFGGDLERVWIWQPIEPIWDIAMAIHALVAELEIDYVIVDSATYACLGEEVEKSVTAVKYSRAIAQIKSPLLTIAHVTKADADSAKHPFGSIFWSNGARLTVFVAADSDTTRLVETRKANQGQNYKVQVDWSWVANGLPDHLEEGAVKGGKKFDRVLVALKELGHATLDEVWQQVNDGYEEDEQIGKQVVSNSLRKLKAAGAAALTEEGEWVFQEEATPTSVRKIRR